MLNKNLYLKFVMMRIMLDTFFESLPELILSLGLWGFFILCLFAILHPIIEAPAALILMTLMTLYTNSIFESIFILYIFHFFGFILIYLFIHRLKFSTLFKSNTRFSFPKVQSWYDSKKEWQHIFVMGLPLIYTYPLRIYWTLKIKSFISFIGKMTVIYTIMYMGNLMMYWGYVLVLERFITNQGVFLAMLIFVYLIYRLGAYKIRKTTL
jgi:hypothetical protein